MTAVRALNGAHDSVEEYCFALNGLGWESDFRQLSPGRGTSAFRAAATDTAAVLRVDFCNRLHQRAVPMKGCQTFGVPFRQQAPGKVGSRVLESNSLLLIDPHHGLDAVVEPGFSAYTFSVSDIRLQQLADLHELPDPTTSAAVPGSERVPEASQLAQIKSVLETVLRQVDTPASLDDTRNLMDLELPGMILRAWFGARGKAVPAPRSRNKVLRRALDYLSAFPREALTVEQLCNNSASSMSTLERAFKEHFGVSPKRYLILSRLSGVRRMLLDSRSTPSIADAANEWGFWHMGSFAANYRRIYGELPSETLRRR